MVANACIWCGCSHTQCECEDRRKAAEENRVREAQAKAWEEQRQKGKS
jgi:hypothetical protein